VKRKLEIAPVEIVLLSCSRPWMSGAVLYSTPEDVIVQQIFWS